MPSREHDGFTEHVVDLLVPWTEVTPRRMFGGVGLFAHGLMFALILDDVLYMKDTKDEHGYPVETNFEKEYFEYDRNGRTVNLGYFKAPEAALEDSAYLVALARDSFKSATLVKKKAGKTKTKAAAKKRPRLNKKVPG